MTTTKFLSLSAAFVLALSGMKASAADVSFSYTYGDQNYEQAGTKKAETYDIAIRLTDPSIVGSRLKNFSVPVALGEDASNISDVSVWVSKELVVENKVNIPDVFSMDAEIVDGVINVTFPENIEVPEDGFYVGYTFKVDKKGGAGDYPIYMAGDPVADGLYVHTSRTYLKWKSQAEAFGHSSAIVVGLEGDFYANALGVVRINDNLNATPGEEMMLKTVLQNHGYEPIHNIEYVINDGVSTQNNIIELDDNQEFYFGQSFVVELPYVAPVELDEYPFSLEITKVNGEENLDLAKSIETKVLVLTAVPIHKPLMEEYTGLWCGWCPRGYVGLEAMNLRHPDEFVAISYHNGDAMERISSSNYPSAVSGFPAAYVDRTYSVDAYYGVSDEDFGIEPFWQSIQETFTPVAINGAAKEEEDGSITVTSDITFIKTVAGSYKVAYAIVANGLTEPSWGQSNNYRGYNPNLFIPEFEKFCTGGGKVYDLIFDDVFAAGSNLKGEPKSLIENVVKDQLYTHSYSFAANAGMSLSKYDLFANAKELYAVIILLDEKGAVVNTNKILVEGHTAVESIAVDNNSVNTEFFDLNGRRVSDPSNGIFIKIDTKENGEKIISKVIRK